VKHFRKLETELLQHVKPSSKLQFRNEVPDNRNWRRLDAEHLELSVKITDPKMYTKPWIALDKLSLRLQPPHLDIQEMECSPSDQEHWNKYFGDQSGPTDNEPK
jgi:hypothetical protein